MTLSKHAVVTKGMISETEARELFTMFERFLLTVVVPDALVAFTQAARRSSQSSTPKLIHLKRCIQSRHSLSTPF
jgi:hypothetical protein